jgi:hypothetical protein
MTFRLRFRILLVLSIIEYQIFQIFGLNLLKNRIYSPKIFGCLIYAKENFTRINSDFP